MEGYYTTSILLCSIHKALCIIMLLMLMHIEQHNDRVCVRACVYLCADLAEYVQQQCNCHVVPKARAVTNVYRDDELPLFVPLF